MKEATLELVLERIEDDETDYDGRLTVFTVDENDNPLDGVKVIAESQDGAFGSSKTYEGVTQSAAVSIELPVSEYSVTASKDGYKEAQGSVTAEDFE